MRGKSQGGEFDGLLRGSIRGDVHETTGRCYHRSTHPNRRCRREGVLGCGLCVECWDEEATTIPNRGPNRLIEASLVRINADGDEKQGGRARWCVSCLPPPAVRPRYPGQCEALGKDGPCPRPSSYLTSQVVLSGARRWLSVCKFHEHKIAVENAEAAGLSLSWEEPKAKVLV